MIKFSALVSVYAKESPSNFSLCLDSLLSQTLMPDELIIVKDGPLTSDLESVIQNLNFSGALITIDLPVNVTQGPARAAGLLAASHEWVAIMDSDDICCKDRFEKQVRMIELNPILGIVGGQIDEFKCSPDYPNATKLVPTQHIDICTYAKKRNPFNHMTIMLNKKAAIEAGNYVYFPWFEDYDLIVRMINQGVICGNHSEVLVHARVGNGMYGRRRGISYIKSEWCMQIQLHRLGLINCFELCRNLLLRVPIRLLPSGIIELFYNRILRGGNK